MIALALAAATIACGPYTVPGSGVEGDYVPPAACSRTVDEGLTVLPIDGRNGLSEAEVHLDYTSPLGERLAYLDLLRTQGGCTDLWARFGVSVKVNRCRAKARVWMWRTKDDAPTQALVTVTDNTVY